MSERDGKVAVLSGRFTDADILWRLYMRSAPQDVEVTPVLFRHYLVALQVVVEGWEELGLIDPTVKMLLDQPVPEGEVGEPRTLFVDLLRGARNDIAHFQGKHYPPRFATLLDTSPSAWWTRNLHGGFRAFFEAWRPSST